MGLANEDRTNVADAEVMFSYWNKYPKALTLFRVESMKSLTRFLTCDLKDLMILKWYRSTHIRTQQCLKQNWSSNLICKSYRQSSAFRAQPSRVCEKLQIEIHTPQCPPIWPMSVSKESTSKFVSPLLSIERRRDFQWSPVSSGINGNSSRGNVAQNRSPSGNSPILIISLIDDGTDSKSKEITTAPAAATETQMESAGWERGSYESNKN